MKFTMKVITYQAPGGATIDITPQQRVVLEAAGVWPRNSHGEEFCHVSHGLHSGKPTYDMSELLDRSW